MDFISGTSEKSNRINALAERAPVKIPIPKKFKRIRLIYPEKSSNEVKPIVQCFICLRNR